MARARLRPLSKVEYESTTVPETIDKDEVHRFNLAIPQPPIVALDFGQVAYTCIIVTAEFISGAVTGPDVEQCVVA